MARAVIIRPHTRRIKAKNMHAAPKAMGLFQSSSSVRRAPAMGVPARAATEQTVKARPRRIPISEMLDARLANSGLMRETSEEVGVSISEYERWE